MIQKELTGDLKLKWDRIQQGDAEDKCRRMPAYRGCKSVLHNRTYL